jgi:hypothetical protein
MAKQEFWSLLAWKAADGPHSKHICFPDIWRNKAKNKKKSGVS